MIPELGHFALIIALCLTLVLAVFPMIGSLNNTPGWVAMARPLAWGQFCFVAISFACLVNAFLVNDFSVLYVAQHGNTQLPLIYKVSAVWGAHEGSLLLWALILSGWTVAVSLFAPRPACAGAGAGAVRDGHDQHRLSLLPAVYLQSLRPPLRRLPLEGGDLNPLLQDFGLAIHPPMLYMGYVGLSVAFAFAIAALHRRQAGCRLGTLVAALDHRGLGVSDHRHHARQLVGLLRTGLGRLVVLGPGGECLVHALAGRYRADPFAGGDRETRRLQALDGAAGICWPFR